MFGGVNPPGTPFFFVCPLLEWLGAGGERRGAGVGECRFNEPAAVSTASAVPVLSSTTPHYTPQHQPPPGARVLCLVARAPPSVSTEGVFCVGSFFLKNFLVLVR